MAGRFQCVDKVIREMTRRFDGLAESCDHDVMFSLTYLRTTEEYLRAATTPGFFQDPTFVNHEDAVFANYYFRPFDAWHAGRPGAVPEAWRIAFDAADRRTVTGSGDLDDMLTFQAFPVMRENAWRNAERLVAARTSLERALVEASIEQSAAATAHAIVAATAADAPTTAARDAFCAAHHDD